MRAVARTVLAARADPSDPDRPLGVFLFTGPTGVGKTHLARSLAEVLFGDTRRLVRVDMSEYIEEHSVARPIGAPPGHVGHEREELLIAALRTHPHCVVLTSNLDLIPASRQSMGFGSAPGGAAATPAPREALAGKLRPELVNRIDEIVVFRLLGRDALRRIVDGYVASPEGRLQGREVRLRLDEAVYDQLLDLGESARWVRGRSAASPTTTCASPSPRRSCGKVTARARSASSSESGASRSGRAAVPAASPETGPCDPTGCGGEARVEESDAALTVAMGP